VQRSQYFSTCLASHAQRRTARRRASSSTAPASTALPLYTLTHRQVRYLPLTLEYLINIIPGGLNIEGEDESYDFGSGAGFYIDATKEPWTKGYKMESYITKELPDALFSQFKELDSSKVSITGHSMGGHGALTLFLKNPGKYKSVSAFAPIANPVNAPWGQKAFKGYIGDNEEEWKKHDATELIKQWKGPLEVLIDVVRTSTR